MNIRTATDSQAVTVPLKAHICIAGEGPAGMIMGLFLAKHSMDVVVLEKNTPAQQAASSFERLLEEMQFFREADGHIEEAMQELRLFLEEEKVSQLLRKPLYKQHGQINRMLLMALYRQADQQENLKLIKNVSVEEVIQGKKVIASVEGQVKYAVESGVMIGSAAGPEEISLEQLADFSLFSMEGGAETASPQQAL